MNFRILLLVTSVALFGCPGPAEVADAGRDSGVTDSGTLDSGIPVPDGGYVCTVEVIDGDAGAKIVPYISLALDPSGVPHAAFYDFAQRTLKYASRGDGGWTSQSLNGQGDGGSLVTLRLASNGKAHISYYNSTATAVMYATDTTGSWVIEQAAAGSTANALALDSSGVPRIAYTTASLGGMKFLRLGTRSSLTWSGVDIGGTSADAGSGGAPDQPSFAIDTLGKNHVAWFDTGVGALKYSTDVSGSWVTQVIDSPMVGSGNAIALDPSGKVHITYYDSTNSKLKYATNATGVWVVTPIDAAGQLAIGDTALAVDTAGKLHITYYQGTVRDLAYVTNRTGTWVATPLVVSGNDVGNTSSVAVDSTRNVLHVGFSDRTSGAYRYVTCK